MKKILLVSTLLIAISCQKEMITDPIDPAIYNCSLAFADNSQDHPKKERFEAAMKKVIEIVPGVQIAIRSKDNNVWLGAQGYVDIPNNVLFEKCSKTMIGSVSKIHTAVLIMQLHDDGILSIDDPITNWIDPEIADNIENAKESTIKNLLNHTSGITDYLETKHFINGVNSPYFKISPSEKMEYAYGKKAQFPVGEKFEYSNSNYVLLGLIIEKARNMSFAQAEQIYIAEPLGLLNTISGTTEDPIPAGVARPYLAQLNHSNYVDIMPFAVSDAATGDGAIASNMQESLTFIEAIFNKTIISESVLKLMLKEEYYSEDTRLFGENISYGLGLRKFNHKHGLAIGHSGSTSAYWSHTYHFPNDNVTIAIAFNGDTESDTDYDKLQALVTELVDIAFE